MLIKNKKKGGKEGKHELSKQQDFFRLFLQRAQKPHPKGQFPKKRKKKKKEGELKGKKMPGNNKNIITS